jgi:uncharacterized protein HemX
MNKNIFIVVLAVICIGTTAFGVYQKQQAGYYESLAIRNKELAEQLAQQAEQQMKRAEEQRMIAEAQMQRAMANEAIARELASKK